MSELLNAALEYADRGLKVFPIWPETKTPITANGHLDATTDSDQIIQWWTAHPTANIGMNLADSGLVAIDVDAYKTECEWDYYRGANVVDAGFVQKSPRGGLHYIFTADPSDTFVGSPCPGVDVKHKGYVVLAPSTYEGKAYEVVRDDEIGQLPAWLADKIRKSSANTFDIDLGFESGHHRSDEVLITEIRNGQSWHNNILKLTGRYVNRGLRDVDIQAITDCFTLPGYTVQQTRAEVQKMLDGARKKDFAANTTKAEKPSTFFTKISEVDRTPPAELIEGMIYQHTLASITGPSYGGKSFFAIDMGLSVATGVSFHGRTTSQRPVAYVIAEGQAGFIGRIDAWCAVHEQNIEDIPFFLSNQPISMRDDAWVAATKQELRTYGKVGLVFIDTLNRNFGGGNENSPEHMGEFINGCDELMRDLDCTVIPIHHTGKDHSAGARGHSSFYGALDTEIKVTGSKTTTFISCGKQKDAPEFPDMEFLRVETLNSLVLEEVEARERKKFTKLTVNEQLAFDTFQEAYAEKQASTGMTLACRLHLDEWRPVFSERHTGDNEKSKTQAFRRAREALQNKGLLQCKDDYYSYGDKAS